MGSPDPAPERRLEVHTPGSDLLLQSTVARLSGFGQNRFADGYRYQPRSLQEIEEVLALARRSGRQVTLRGAGRSYGDAAIGAECIVLDLTRFNRILSWDKSSGVIEVEAGATLGDIWNYTLGDGWWLPVVSGTTFPTVGGALAMNIHGKNNFAAGTLGEHVEEMDVLTSSGESLTLGASDPLFGAVVGGAGLLGVITRVKLRMKKVESGLLRVLGVSCASWEEQFRTFDRFEGDAEYLVSWIDCFARGSSAGRGVFHAAWHAKDTSQLLDPQAQHLPSKILFAFPKSSVWRILRLLNRRPTMRLLNWAKHAAGRKLEHEKVKFQGLAAFNFLLDYVPDWERAYWPGGLIQCQYFIPKERAPEAFAGLLEMQQEAKLESYLGVMKRHRADRFLLSHAVDGYSLALDFKVTRSNRERLWDLARRMNDYALSAGGRFYFAKDSTLAAEQAARFLGLALHELRRLKRELDPHNLFTSELARRLSLVEEEEPQAD
jgi:decaprenylphospho-beta-D-ribofuranose 2-oxidase